MSAGGAPFGWEDLEALFEAALARPPGEREIFLNRVCPDAALRSEVESLLVHANPAERLFNALAASLERLPASSGWADPPTGPGPPAGDSAERSDGPPDTLLGRTVGHYRIEERIGGGGMGVVYRASDIRLDREVALKFLPPHLGLDPEAKDRFLAEARAAAALDHPNICTVHEIGETEEGRFYLALACYEGETLEKRISRGPLPITEAVEIAGCMAHALGAAHAHGVVHRDVKPGNVMLTTDGEVKLLDFGLAKRTDLALTRPGITPGTVAYMSPEQMRGENVDARTDLWSLGVVLYEMLAGRRPFRGERDRVLLDAVVNKDPVPLREVRPEVPRRLETVIEHLLAKDPAERYANAEAVVADLERESSPSPVGRFYRLPTRPTVPVAGRSSTRGRRRPARLAGALAILVTLGGAAIWMARRGIGSDPAGPAPERREPSIALLPLANHSPDPADGALADGMTEELMGMLARAGNLRVIARTSAFAFRNRQMDVRRIADSLGVSNILEGSLQKIGSRLRVQVRLVDGGDGSTRWSETYDREFRDVFSMQEEIAATVADELNVRLAGGAGGRILRRQMPDIAAYELYLRGNDQTLLRSADGVRQGIEYFSRAIAVDTTYAAAYAGLARMYMVLSVHDDPGRPVRELRDLAQEAALKAVALDDSLAEAHATLSLVRTYADYDLASAEDELARAVALDPDHPLVLQWLAQLYLIVGRPTEALTQARRALENDPLSPAAHAELAHALVATGRYDEALAQLRQIASVQPPLLRASLYASYAYAGKRMWPEAIAALRPQAGDNGASLSLSLYAYMLARGGHRDEALRVEITLLERWNRARNDAFELAVVHAGLGELDEAFAWLDRAIDDRSLIHPNIHIMEPIFADLRGDPRFERLRQRFGFRRP